MTDDEALDPGRDRDCVCGDAWATYQRGSGMTDDEALDRFEALVLSQKPAEKPWTPVTDDSFEARKAIEGKHPDLIRDVLRPRSVTDAGMGSGHLVHLLRDLGIHAGGFDKKRGGICYGDLAAKGLAAMAPAPCYFFARMADVVICREVLEHLTIREIKQAVSNLCELSSRLVYVTTRFAKAPAHLLDVDTSDDLDPTHISMLNQGLLRTLFVLEGFKRRADLEEQMDWQRKGRCLVYERVA